MKGFILNTLFVLAGSTLGIVAGKKITENIKEIIFDTLGLITLFIGFKMCLASPNIVHVVISLVAGTVIGSYLKIEEHVYECLERLKKRYFNQIQGIEGFIIASTLFCVGSMTIIGSIKDGLYNDPLLIKTKSIMDGFASILLASQYGLSVIFSALTVFLIQGVITIFSKYLTFLLSSLMMGYIDGVGGFIILSIGLNLLRLKNIKTLNMLPSLIIIIVLAKWLH
ncbi:MAG: DUF554 domain-containing protein [Proteobacteria bacterium]|nr:DUF554 domain-containing protein [Pseudomonadota bacterium]